MKSSVERFWSKINVNGPMPRPDTRAASLGPCWLWAGAPDRDGYGRFFVGTIDGRKVETPAHRFSYELLVGPIPEGLLPDHLCRNTGCPNPEHLEPVTPLVNLLRGDTIIARQVAVTECPRSHPYDAANTYLRPSGARLCRTCRRERWRAAASAKARKR